MKTLILCAPLLAGVLQGAPQPRLLEPVESAPKEIGGLEFSIATESSYHADGQNIVLQLRVSNPGKAALLFPTFDTLSVIVTGPDGKPHPLGGNRDATAITPNILLQPGKSICWPLIARLLPSGKAGNYDLEFKDPTNSGSSTSLSPGTHTALIHLQATPYDFDQAYLPAPLWTGSGVTESVTFVIPPIPKRQ